MIPDHLFWLALIAKMAVTAGFVIAATVAAERAGALVGALVATLPILAAPAYIFLAFDHDAAFIAETALGTLAVNAVNGIYALVMAALAQRQRLGLVLIEALALWIGLAILVRFVEWTPLSAGLLNLVILPICMGLGRRFRYATMPPPRRRWIDLAVRAGLVALLVAAIITFSFRIGPMGSGILAVFPIVLTSVYVILHRRVSGQAAGAVLANSISGLAGLALAALALHLSAVPLGLPAALTLALAISMGWNLLVWFARRYGIPL